MDIRRLKGGEMIGSDVCRIYAHYAEESVRNARFCRSLRSGLVMAACAGVYACSGDPATSGPVPLDQGQPPGTDPMTAMGGAPGSVGNPGASGAGGSAAP